MSHAVIPSLGRSGRPRKLEFSDLFLWHPAIELGLTGFALSDLIGERSPGMLAVCRDIGRKRNVSLPRLHACLADMRNMNGGHPMADELARSLDGNESMLASIGLWQCYFYSRSTEGDHWPPRLNAIQQHFVDVEEALKAPTEAFRKNDLARCARLLDASAVMALYLWPGAIEQIRSATTSEQGTPVRAVVMLELMLNYIAAHDAQVTVIGLSAKPEFDGLFPDFPADQSSTPTARFFNWLADYSGAGKYLATYIPQISKPAKDFDLGSARGQLGRWKRGGAFPSNDVLDAIFLRLYGERAWEDASSRHKEWALSWAKAYATRRIDFLVEIVGVLRRVCGPAVPFGFETHQDWRANRYLHWYRYWLPLLKPAA